MKYGFVTPAHPRAGVFRKVSRMIEGVDFLTWFDNLPPEEQTRVYNEMCRQYRLLGLPPIDLSDASLLGTPEDPLLAEDDLKFLASFVIEFPLNIL